MSQKTNPTSLRLQKTNKNFSSSWYSDFFYSQMVVSDLKARSYIESLSEQIGRAQMFLYIQRYYKKMSAYLFFLDAREIRSQREKVLRLPGKRQKGATSTTASVAFLRSCFSFGCRPDLKKGNSSEHAVSTLTASSVLFPALQQLASKDCNTSIFRDLVVQNCKNSSTTLRTTRTTRTTKVKKTLQSAFIVNPPFTVSLPALYNLCVVGQASLKQRALYSSVQQHALMLNMFHGAMETAFLLAYSSSNRLAKNKDLNFTCASSASLLDLHRSACSASIASLCSPNFAPAALQSNHAKQQNEVLRTPSVLGVQSQAYKHAWLEMQKSTNLPLEEILYGGKYIRPYPYSTSDAHSVTLRYPCFSSKHKKTPVQANPVLTSIYPIRVVQDIQFACFFAREIAYLLQKGASFKQIQNRLLNEYKKSEILKGIRLSCSGRIGGRSKKAQKSKTQSVQCGETSLHVLSSKLSFASKSTNTPFGKIGIKLWLCFK